MGYKVCIDGYTETTKECADWADEGYETCGEWGQDCTNWAKNCVASWIPFIGPAICKVFEWVCTAFQAVCKFGVWISKWVCYAWNVFQTFICLVWQTIEYGLTLGAVFFKAFLSIPILGAIFKQFTNLITALGFGIPGFIVEGFFCGLLGICPTKKLRLCVIIGMDGGELVATEAQVQPMVDVMKQIYKDQANVTVYEHIAAGKDNKPSVTPSCDAKGWLEDFWINGTSLEHSANMHCREYRSASISGLASPIYAFAVREVVGKNGCSLGPLSNYIVFEAPTATCADNTHLAHEAAHACGLWHQDPTSNLMFRRCFTGGRNQLKGWQKAIVRGSKYVTYF